MVTYCRGIRKKIHQLNQQNLARVQNVKPSTGLAVSAKKPSKENTLCIEG